jgi:Tfp pilus assembly protein PilP
MKLTLVLLLVICCVLAGCSASKPSSQQMQSALDRFMKKNNPAATASIVKFTPSERYIGADFQFTNFSVTDKTGVKQTIPSGKVLADFWLKGGKWEFDQVVINDEQFPVGEDVK